ncbi:MAG TPA: hypothetical protein VKV35_00765 [Streptosporangiaceae bacterium]|nr:hypothetical protein [Streptosporangiaceae bacterium]
MTGVESLFRAPVVVAVWGACNTVLAGIAAGFVAAGRFPLAAQLAVYLYAGALCIIYAIAVALWLIRRREPLGRGLRLPRRPAAVLLLAAGVALLWLGLPFGRWLPITAAVPLAFALGLEISARRG